MAQPGLIQRTRRFQPGEAVRIISKVSKHRNEIGVVEKYCNGRYKNICRIKLTSGQIIQIFDTNLEKCELNHI